MRSRTVMPATIRAKQERRRMNDISGSLRFRLGEVFVERILGGMRGEAAAIHARVGRSQVQNPAQQRT